MRDAPVGTPLSCVIPTTMNDKEFDDLLKLARGTCPLPTSFRQGVWGRIERAESEVSKGTAWFPTVIGAVVRPWGAVVGMAATITAGIWLGSASIQEADDPMQAYGQSISPFAHTHGR